MNTSLDKLNIGDEGIIVSMKTSILPKSMLTELLEMGFYPGAILKLERISKQLGNVICSIGNNRIGLRIEDSQHIEVLKK